MILRIKGHYVNLLKEEAQKADPIEACAVLFGQLSLQEAAVRRVVVTPNKLQSTARFEIDPETFAKAFTEADRKGLEFIGLFHSHPAAAKPSSIDLKYMKLWGDAIWLILSSTTGDLAAYQMSNSKVSDVVVRIT